MRLLLYFNVQYFLSSSLVVALNLPSKTTIFVAVDYITKFKV